MNIKKLKVIHDTDIPKKKIIKPSSIKIQGKVLCNYA